jgi:hypothetical protein
MAKNFEDLVIALFGSLLSTTGTDAKDNISDALFRLGSKEPAIVLSAAHTFLLQNNKVSYTQINHRRLFS